MAPNVSRKRGGAAAGGGADRLSALPDELLHSILSFLTARQAVQTSVLSRRWRDVWPSIPCLDIDYREWFAAASRAASYYDPDNWTWKNLRAFTSTLLDKHRAPVLERFQLHVGKLLDGNVVADWVRRGIGYRPAELVVAVAPGTGRKLNLPAMEPATACRLTRLRLSYVWLGAGFVNSLRSGCPVLRDLELVRCDCNFQEIVSSTVTSLVVEYCCWVFTVPVPRTATVPAVVSLRLAFLIGARYDEFLVNGACCQQLRASISAVCEYSYVDKPLVSLLGNLCNVRTLELWRFGYQTLLKGEEQNFPKLHNLTTLLMGECNVSMQFSLLRLFVKNVPSLEKITLKHCKYLDTRTRYVLRKMVTRYKKLMCFKSEDLKLIGINYKDSNTSNLFGLLMCIRTKLEANTVILSKESRTNKLND